MAAIPLTVNAQRLCPAVDPETPLMLFLRNDLGLNGPKFGCGYGECGACTVLVDGIAARACVIPIRLVEGREVVTLEGLATEGTPHAVQQAFIDAQAAQCGYCLNGMIMTAKALLDRNQTPSDEEICNELRFNLCRCGTHVEIVAAVRLAAERLLGCEGAAG